MPAGRLAFLPLPEDATDLVEGKSSLLAGFYEPEPIWHVIVVVAVSRLGTSWCRQDTDVFVVADCPDWNARFGGELPDSRPTAWETLSPLRRCIPGTLVGEV